MAMDIIMPVIIITTNISIKVNPLFNFFIVFYIPLKINIKRAYYDGDITSRLYNDINIIIVVSFMIVL
jgi:hypothetical protein|tara:strand:- start:13267 stop:13470 length:204 start_codon:yes stop_codon:yes gene_type:complete